MNAQIRNSAPFIHIENLIVQVPPQVTDLGSLPAKIGGTFSATKMHRFTKIGDGLSELPDDASGHKAVLDSKFGIYRAIGAWPHALDADDTDKRIAQLNAEAYLGLTTWRKPTLEEEFAIADHTRYRPAANIDFFPDMQSSYYRTSTVYPADTSCVFVVGFNYGYVDGYYRGHGAFCRPVASVPASQ